MQRVKERDEQEALKLDEHFKRTLTHVRRYILNLRSAEEAHLCRIWLDKLKSVTFSQRNLRNEYLLELSRQLRAGVLEGVFRTEPPNDSLIPLSPSCRVVCVSSSLSELSDRNYRNCLTLSKRLDPRNYSRSGNKARACNSDSTCPTVNTHCRSESAIEKDRLKLWKHRIDAMSTALGNLQIQNERLKQELLRCQENNTADNEVFQLRNHVKQLTSHARSQSLVWKVKTLKKTVAKLKRLNSTIEHVYEKKLQRTNKNLEIEALRLQFQGQTSELCLSLCSEKRDELHELVASLEEKYKTLLATSLENQRQDYCMKIAALEDELHCLKNNSRSE